MQSRRWYWCQGAVIGFILALCLYNFVLHTVPLSPEATFLDSSGPLRRLSVIPFIGTENTDASPAMVLNCNQTPKNDYSKWHVYEKKVSGTRTDQKILQEDERKEAAENTSPLHQCLVQVELSPCSCTRTVTVHLPGPCPSTSPQRLLHHIKTTLGESSCGDLATLRGTGQKVLSYSVGGRHPNGNEYQYGMSQLAPRLQQIYPGWITRVYTDNSTDPYTWGCPLACNNPYLDFCDVTQLPGLGDVSGSHPRVWRFAVMGDPLVRLYMMRDSDSPVLQREVDAVNYWLRSGTCYHVMRDNPSHNVPMLAGMWGGCLDTWNSKKNILLARTIALCGSSASDQTILKWLVWPVARHNGTSHDTYSCRQFPGSLPFPTQRVSFTFVGQRTYRKKFRKDRIYRKCPPACRPKNHKDWLYC